jgi:Transposase IS4
MSKTPIEGKPYYFTSWMDSRPVHGLSTLPTTQSLVQRKAKAEGSEVFKNISVPRPDMWGWYNHGMGGTDLHDQFNKYYRTQVRCNKWPIRIYMHFMTSCVTNAYILYKSIKNLQTKDLSLKDFILELITTMGADLDEEEKRRGNCQLSIATVKMTTMTTMRATERG